MSQKALIFVCDAVVMLIILACGMTAPLPSSDGQKGSATVNMATHINTAVPVESLLEAVFVVTADSLQIRPCPYRNDETCPPFERGFVAGDVVMGFCRTFEDGSIWLEFDGQKYAAVLFDGEWLMMGDCP